MARWRITEETHLGETQDCSVPGGLTPDEIDRMLSRLAARDLAFEEVIGSSLRKKMNGYRVHLEVHREIKGGLLWIIGLNTYTARYEAD